MFLTNFAFHGCRWLPGVVRFSFWRCSWPTVRIPHRPMHLRPPHPSYVFNMFEITAFFRVLSQGRNGAFIPDSIEFPQKFCFLINVLLPLCRLGCLNAVLRICNFSHYLMRFHFPKLSIMLCPPPHIKEKCRGFFVRKVRLETPGMFYSSVIWMMCVYSLVSVFEEEKQTQPVFSCMLCRSPSNHDFWIIFAWKKIARFPPPHTFVHEGPRNFHEAHIACLQRCMPPWLWGCHRYPHGNKAGPHAGCQPDSRESFLIDVKTLRAEYEWIFIQKS